MNIAIHRTGIFFVGLFPIVMLIWAWADSMIHGTVWLRHRDSTFLSVLLSLGAIEIESSSVIAKPDPFGTDLVSNPYPHDEGAGKFNRYELFDEDGSGVFPGFEWEASVTDTEAYHEERMDRVIPIWLILACYLPLWLTVSWWAARRKEARIAAAMPQW